MPEPSFPSAHKWRDRQGTSWALLASYKAPDAMPELRLYWFDDSVSKWRDSVTSPSVLQEILRLKETAAGQISSLAETD
jgi:hypothetical protein